LYGRGMHKLSNEVMKEASKSLKEKGIKTCKLKKNSLKMVINFLPMDHVFLLIEIRLQ
jgi:hypothetical protein